MTLALARMVRLTALTGALVLLTSGCFLRGLLGGVTVNDLGDFIAAMFADATVAYCDDVLVPPEGDERRWTTVVECEYHFASGDDFLGTRTSTSRLVSEFGLFGVFVDPVILQVPNDAHAFDATFREGSEPARPLEITVVDEFLTAPGNVVTAETGRQFVILELPDDVAGRLPSGDARTGTPFAFDLDFEVSALEPVEVKPMFALAIEMDGTTYYPPMLPCVTDFSQAPAFELPVADDGRLHDLMPQVADAFDQAADLVCDDRVYDFTDGNGPPPPDEPDPDPTTSVAIDVKPGSDTNPVNPRSQGLIPVAVLTTAVADGEGADFDATSIDVSTLRFGPREAGEAHGHGHATDVDGDGDTDLVVHFHTQDTGISCGDTDVALTGATIDGTAFEGTDSITTDPC